ncbi:MAG: hypothetical protein H0W75_05765 [Chitinophagaceae bacterium]|nr:hypothetical protein [Chitinophagaceae bacterium]
MSIIETIVSMDNEGNFIGTNVTPIGKEIQKLKNQIESHKSIILSLQKSIADKEEILLKLES